MTLIEQYRAQSDGESLGLPVLTFTGRTRAISSRRLGIYYETTGFYGFGLEAMMNSLSSPQPAKSVASSFRMQRLMAPR